MPANRDGFEQELKRLAKAVEELQYYLPALRRLTADHEFRDLLAARRRRLRNRVAFFLGAFAACATIGLALASVVSFLVHLF